VHDFLTRI